jgi:hypothetical protein
MSHPVRWVTSGSAVLYAVGATFINPALVAVVGRTIGSKPVGERQTLLGYGLREGGLW